MDNDMKLIYMAASLFLGALVLATALINSSYAVPKSMAVAVIFYFSARLIACLVCKFSGED